MQPCFFEVSQGFAAGAVAVAVAVGRGVELVMWAAPSGRSWMLGVEKCMGVLEAVA